MFYALYNKGNGKLLKHPIMGIWSTTVIAEAQAMLKSCNEYLTAQGLQAISENFIIIDAESGEEWKSV
jgi:hypothetical protein